MTGSADGGANQALAGAERARETGVVPKRPVALVRGRAARLWDAEGREYLDFGATHGVSLVGHAHPRVVRAIEEQARRLVHVAPTYPNDARAAYLERLVGVAPPGLGRAFLCNSGTEAVEAAMKFARAHTGRRGFVAAHRGFHGRTLGALSLTHKPEHRAPFEPLVPGVVHVPYGDPEALKAAVTRDVAALVLEPVQGEAGVVVPPPGYLRAAHDLCEDSGALLVADEVQTGLGRTGRMWAVDHEGVVPDILCFAKGAGGGVPLGGILLREEVCTLPPSAHGSTFGGSPLACAAGLAVLEALERERLVERAAALGERLLRGLREAASPQVREARGRGLMAALELRGRNVPVLNGLLAQGVLALPTGTNMVRFLPPLVVTELEVDAAVAATAKSLAGAEAHA